MADIVSIAEVGVLLAPKIGAEASVRGEARFSRPLNTDRDAYGA